MSDRRCLSCGTDSVGPRHRLELVIRVGATDRRDLLELLGEFVALVEEREGVIDCVHGGPGRSGFVRVVVDTEQTRESYAAELESFLEARRSQQGSRRL